MTSCDACDTLNSQDILNLFLKKVYLNETDFQKGITGSSFHCKKIIFFLGKFPLYLVAISAEDTEIREEDAEILMLQTCSEKFAKKLIQAEIIPESDADIYVFGCYQFGMMLLNIVTTIGLGILFRLFLPCVLLNLSFIPIRISAGGHHADSPVKCYVLSTLLIAALLAILKWVSVSLLAAWILILAASAVLLWLAPVETENNPLDETEVRVYRRRTRIVLGIELLAALLATLLHRNFLVTIIGFGLLTASFMLVVGACANLKQHWKRCV